MRFLRKLNDVDDDGARRTRLGVKEERKRTRKRMQGYRAKVKA